MTISIVSSAFESSDEGLRAKFGAFRHESPHGAIIAIAIAVPIFAFLAFVIARTTLTFIAEQNMNAAVAATARQIQSDPDGVAQFTPSQIRGRFCGHLPVFMDCSGARLHLDIRSFASIAEIDPGQPPKRTGRENAETLYNLDSPGGPDNFVVVRAYYRWSGQPIYQRLFSRHSSSPTSYLSAFAVFKKDD